MSSVPADPDGLFPDLAPAQAAPAGPVEQWTRIHSTTARCDRCVHEVVEARGHAPRPALARWRHRTPDGDELLCYPHARTARGEADR